jgi:hypothetical protein
MTLCVVVIVWLKARHDLWGTELRGQLQSLEISRKQNIFQLEHPENRYGNLPGVFSELKRLDAEINQIQQQLG